MKREITQLATAFNTTNFSLLEVLLSDNVVCTNAAGETFVGAENVKPYFFEKFTIAAEEKIQVYAELGTYKNVPCIIITQGDFKKAVDTLVELMGLGEDMFQVTDSSKRLLSITISGNKIDSLSFHECNSEIEADMIPSGVFPGSVVDNSFSFTDVHPNDENALSYCIIANMEFDTLTDSNDEKTIMGWRSKYLPLRRFAVPEALKESVEMLLFHYNYEMSGEMYHKAIDIEE